MIRAWIGAAKAVEISLIIVCIVQPRSLCVCAPSPEERSLMEDIKRKTAKESESYDIIDVKCNSL